jgi:lipid II:glycine glycyltransferase (peptidoglycan interpeptide bridge formation enzyme)
MSFFDIRQSSQYADYMRAIGWTVETIDGVHAFIKKIPLAGTIIKIQRPNKIPSLISLQQLKKKFNARSIVIEPDLDIQYSTSTIQYSKEPYLPTKTIHIDLKSTEEKIFNSFSEAKRRAVRRAEKLRVIVKPSSNIDDFIHLKNKSAGFLGFLTTTTIKKLWQTFMPKNVAVLSAYKKNMTNPIACVLLLFYSKTAYYWQAAASKEGKKSFAPTLLVWEALKLAKSRKYILFDFEGTYDERYPKLNTNWSGFTKFKQGFGGKEVEYPKPINM